MVVGDGDMAQAKRRLIERAGGLPCPETEAHHARFGFVAMEDEKAAESVSLRLKRAGLLVNVADRPDLCDFTLPSILDRDPVMVAVSTGGASAGMAKHLRLRLETILPQSLGPLASRLSAMREKIRAQFPDGNDRRRAIDQALGERGMLDPFDPDSAQRTEQWLSDPAAFGDRTIDEFTISSDDPDDLTLRQARALGRADTVIHDTAISAAVLIRARADAVRLPLPASPPESGHTVILKRGQTVAN